MRRSCCNTQPQRHPGARDDQCLRGHRCAIGARAFVGSFNFDPRSALLNTEMGVLIDSPVLARRIEQAFETKIAGKSYRVQLASNGDLQWQSIQPGSAEPPSIDTVEPGSNWLSRWAIRLLGLLPIDWLL